MKQRNKKVGTNRIFKITNVLISGIVVGKKLKATGDPDGELATFFYEDEATFNKAVSEMENRGFKTELKNGAHKVTHGFTETLGTGTVVKKAVQQVKQEIYENGKWRSMVPSKEGTHVEVEETNKPWYKDTKIWSAIVIVGAVIAYVVWG